MGCVFSKLFNIGAKISQFPGSPKEIVDTFDCPKKKSVLCPKFFDRSMQTARKKTALVLGATGLVGRALVHQLLNDDRYDRVSVLVRRAYEPAHAKLTVEIIDFDRPDASKIKGDDLYCALGTTLKKAGSKEAQYRVDFQYPYEIGKIAKANGVRQFLLVSSLGANAKSSNFYLRTKGMLEYEISGLNFATFISARPSFLLGEREEFRLGERIGIAVVSALGPLVPKKYRGIQADKVAAALIENANNGSKGIRFLESDVL
jgi:uncharacterized protein YbjT (DUF2867 family)